jgi:small acid-soluble spore protein A (major alpha-type SASP)
MANRNPILVQGAEQLLDKLKTEIAGRLNVQLGAEQTARANGSVGGEMTKHLVAMAQQQLSGAQGHIR